MLIARSQTATTDDGQDSPKVEVQRKSREGTANTTESRRSASPVRKGKMTPEEVSIEGPRSELIKSCRRGHLVCGRKTEKRRGPCELKRKREYWSTS
jgi:hypothetical protein